MAAEELHVADAFPPPDREAWQAVVADTLEGVSLRDLHRPSEDPRLPIAPIYFPEDAPAPEQVGWPGTPPFLRGPHPLGVGEHGWHVVSRPTTPDASRAAEHVAEDLDAGATEVWLSLGPERGVRIATAGDVAVLLERIEVPEVILQFDAGPDAFVVMATVAEVLEGRGAPLHRLHGGWGFDPLGTLLEEGELLGGLRSHRSQFQEAARWSGSHTPAMTLALVREAPFAEAGAGGILRLGLALATGAEYLRWLLDAGVHIEQAAPRVRFSLAVGQDFFVEIARLRAARLTWAKMVTAFGGPEEVRRMRLHAHGTLHHRTRWDAWGNLLRATNEATAAVLGGAEAITVLPHDVLFEQATARSRRLARNVHWILREEAHLARTADPAAGSWYVEALTQRIARAAWDVMRSVEREGGMARAIRRGHVHDMLEAERRRQRERVARRELSTVGVSEYPDPTESTPPALRSSRWVEAEVGRPYGDASPEGRMERLREAAVAAYRATTGADEGSTTAPSVLEATRRAVAVGVDLYALREAMAAALPNLYVQPLDTWSRAAPWESLREEAERFVAIRGHRPLAEVLVLGPPAEHRVVLDWTRGLLLAGGFDVREMASPESLDAPGDPGADALVVACGTTQRLREELSRIEHYIERSGPARFAVAGGAPDTETLRVLRERGVRWFLHEGANLLDALMEAQRALGVRR